MMQTEGEFLNRLDSIQQDRRSYFNIKADITEAAASLSKLLSEKNEKSVQFEADAASLCELFTGPKSKASLLPDGTFHAVYQVRGDSGKGVILRVGIVESAGSSLSFLVEERLISHLVKSGVPVPEMLDIDIMCNKASYPFVIMEEMRYPTLKSLEHPANQALPPHLLKALGRITAQLHFLQGEGYGLLNVNIRSDFEPPVGMHALWEDYLLLRLEDHLELCRAAEAITAVEQKNIYDLLIQAAPLYHNAPSRLLHGDLGHHNVLTNEERITALLDWEDALYGDPIFDIAGWATFNRPEAYPIFLQGYLEEAELPDEFDRLFWLYYLRIAISKTAHRRRFGIKDPPGRPPASMRIQRAMDHLNGKTRTRLAG